MATDIYSRADFDPAIAERVIEIFAEGFREEDAGVKRMNVTQICEEVGISMRVLNVWLSRYPAFLAQFNQARMLYADRLMEEALEIADNKTEDWYVHETAKGEVKLKANWDNVNRAKLQVEVRRLLARSFFPERYGDKLEVHSTSTITVIDETTEGKQLRLRNILEEYKQRGGELKSLFDQLGLSEVNVLPEDFRLSVQNTPQQMLEKPMAITIPRRPRKKT